MVSNNFSWQPDFHIKTVARNTFNQLKIVTNVTINTRKYKQLSNYSLTLFFCFFLNCLKLTP